MGLAVNFLQTSSSVQVTKALHSLMTDHEDISKGFELEDCPKTSEKIDALEVMDAVFGYISSHQFGS